VLTTKIEKELTDDLRCLDTTARMASRTEELFVLPPPVGAGIHSRGVKGARVVELSCTMQYEVSYRTQGPKNRAFDQVSLRCGCYK
jgi:hypothetical protein